MSEAAFEDSDNDLMSVLDGTGSDVDSLYDEGPSSTGANRGPFERNSAAAQAAKAIEVAQERLQSPRASIDDIPLLPYRGPAFVESWSDNDILVLDAGPAPPDYTAATSARAGEEHMLQTLDCQHVQHGELDESEHDFASFRTRQPGWSGRIPIWARRRLLRALRIAHQRRRRTAVLFLILVFLLAAFLPLSGLVNFDRSQDPEDAGRFARHHAFPKNMHPTCELDTSEGWLNIPFENPSGFSLIDEVGDVDCMRDFEGCTLDGEVRVFLMPRLSKGPFNAMVLENSPIWVRISVATGFPYVIDKINYRKESDSLVLEAPDLSIRGGEKWKYVDAGRRLVNMRDGEKPCLHFMIEIYLDQDWELTNWVSKLRQFEFYQVPETSMGESTAISSDDEGNKSRYPPVKVTNSTFIDNQYRDVSVSKWNSREIHVMSREGHIGGTFGFEDAIVLENFSGGIAASIDPLPNRSWRGFEGLGTRRLITRTTSGDTTMRIKSRPLNFTSDLEEHRYFPYHVAAEHYSASGSIDLTYPEDWKGTIHGISVYDDITLHGPVTLWPSDRNASGESSSMSIAVGGPEAEYADAGRIEFATEDGSVDITIGDGRIAFLGRGNKWNNE